jgi:hypothetical protein
MAVLVGRCLYRLPTLARVFLIGRLCWLMRLMPTSLEIRVREVPEPRKRISYRFAIDPTVTVFALCFHGMVTPSVLRVAPVALVGLVSLQNPLFGTCGLEQKSPKTSLADRQSTSLCLAGEYLNT